MSTILDTIIAAKRLEVEQRKSEVPMRELESRRFFSRPIRSLRASLLDPEKTGIIAEFKRRSPSKGIINNRDSVESITRMYTAFGASGLSVLTDHAFFGGTLDDLVAARDNDIPILRKDFTIDEYQIVEAKAHGADAILLIAACLSTDEVKRFSAAAAALGLEVLLEIHDESELGHITEDIALVGVNNRDLKTFQVDLGQSVRLAGQLGDGVVKIAESGIRGVEDVQYLKQHGFQGFLIGEHFMRSENPGLQFKEFTYSL